MIVRIHLNQEESERWNDPEGREALLDRARELGGGDDVDRLELYAGAMQLCELAPGSHAKLAARLREMNLKRLADLVDPAKNGDEVERSKIADELQNVGLHFTLRDAEQAQQWHTGGGILPGKGP